MAPWGLVLWCMAGLGLTGTFGGGAGVERRLVECGRRLRGRGGLGIRGVRGGGGGAPMEARGCSMLDCSSDHERSTSSPSSKTIVQYLCSGV